MQTCQRLNGYAKMLKTKQLYKKKYERPKDHIEITTIPPCKIKWTKNRHEWNTYIYIMDGKHKCVCMSVCVCVFVCLRVCIPCPTKIMHVTGCDKNILVKFHRQIHCRSNYSGLLRVMRFDGTYK